MAKPPKKSDANKKQVNEDKIRRTEARKEKNRAKNDARYSANLERVKELGLEPQTREKQITQVVKQGKKTIVKTRTVVKQCAPSELIRRYEREQAAKAQKTDLKKLDAQIEALQAKVLSD